MRADGFGFSIGPGEMWDSHEWQGNGRVPAGFLNGNLNRMSNEKRMSGKRVLVSGIGTGLGHKSLLKMGFAIINISFKLSGQSPSP